MRSASFFEKEIRMNELCIGTIVNTHGIRGEVKIRSCSDFDEIRYRKGNAVYIRQNGELRELKVRSFRRHKGFSLVAFEGMDSINDVEQFKELDVFVDADERKPLPEGEYYFSDLEGLDVFSEDGNRIGRCISVEPTLGAQNNLRIRTEEKKEFLVPFVPAFVVSVSKESGTITIRMMQGML